MSGAAYNRAYPGRLDPPAWIGEGEYDALSEYYRGKNEIAGGPCLTGLNVIRVTGTTSKSPHLSQFAK